MGKTNMKVGNISYNGSAITIKIINAPTPKKHHLLNDALEYIGAVLIEYLNSQVLIDSENKNLSDDIIKVALAFDLESQAFLDASKKSSQMSIRLLKEEINPINTKYSDLIFDE